jgi:hypothetical protein
VFDERRAGAVLKSAPLLSFDGYLTRFVYAAHQRTALEAVRALHAGGYRRATALIEATKYFEDEDPIKPMLMLSVRLETVAVLDLTDPGLLAALGTSRDELTQRIPDLRVGTALPQMLGRLAEASGRIGALIVWSRLVDDARDVVLFPERLGLGYELYDPADDIPTVHPAIADALHRLMEPPW